MFTRGLLLAVVLWALVSRGLVIYLANFNSYNEVYGSIGAVVALLMWLYLSAYAVLLGAAVDAEMAANARREAEK
jgi:membrane protein